VLRTVPDNLRWDPDLLSTALTCYGYTWDNPCTHFPLADATPDFLDNNRELVLKAINIVRKEHETQLFHMIPTSMYGFRAIMIAALRKGWDVLRTRRPHGTFRNDRSLIKFAVEYNWKSFNFASTQLQYERNFVQEIVAIDGRALKFAPNWLKYDYEFLQMALSSTKSTIAHAFEGSGHDMYFLASFAEMVQEKLIRHETFLFEFLRGMQQETDEKSVRVNSSLRILACGKETSESLNRKIAEFADVPLGAKLRAVRSCFDALSKSGF